MPGTLSQPDLAQTAPETPAVGLDSRAPRQRWLKLQSSPAAFVLVSVLGVAYWYLHSWPLWHTDLWGHLAYGRLIWQTGRIPEIEPFMPLSKGVPVVDTAWLTQIVSYGVVRFWGESALHALFAASVTACLAILAGTIQRRTRNVALTLMGLAIFVGVSWEHLQIIRPQLAGVICFVLLLWVLTNRRWSRANWVVMPVLFAFWANLHGSFLVGIATIACFAFGRAFELAWRTQKPAAALRDVKTRRLIALLLMSAAAVLLNPYGPKLYAEVFTVSSNPNLSALVEWGPLTLRMRQGRMFAIAGLALMAAYRLSPRRVSVVESILLLGLAFATLWTSRMIVWFAPVAAYYFALHASAVWRHRRRNSAHEVAIRSSASWTMASYFVICAVLWGCAFGTRPLRGGSETSRPNISPYTPVAAANFLNGRQFDGQVFNTYEWGDYLIWAGVETPNIFVASHAHLIPEKVWQDYLRVISAGDGWEAILDRYNVQAVVVDTYQHDALVQTLKQSRIWRNIYEDSISVIFVRAVSVAADRAGN